MGLHLGVRHLLVDCVALDVDVPVVVTNTEGNVGHCPPAPLLGGELSGVVTLQITSG